MNDVFLISVGRCLWCTEEKTSVMMLSVYEKYLQMNHKHKLIYISIRYTVCSIVCNMYSILIVY